MGGHIVKKIFGKNQVIITALAVMIAVAGYLSVTQENADDAAKLASTDMEITDEADTKDNAEEIAEETIFDISDEDVAQDEGYKLTDNGDIINEDTADENANVGEAVLVSSTIGTEYFDQAKLAREQTRSKNKEILMELVNSTTTTKEQKDKAANEVISMTEDSEKETATENMLEAKGYGSSIVSIVDGSVDVIVNANSLTEKDIAQIEDIVKRKTGVEASNIVITPVGVK